MSKDFVVHGGALLLPPCQMTRCRGTKTHPIKSTLKAAIDYICNPDKTDGKLLVSSFSCAAETADIEFEWTRRHTIDKGTHLGRHLIQAFEPGEVSAEKG